MTVALVETPRRALLTERIAAHREGDALLSWLALLGWKVELDRDDDVFVGVARHITTDGSAFAVSAIAPSRVDVVWALFEQAIVKLGDTKVDRHIFSRRRPSLVG
jgi:hypothetical protein